VNDVVRVRRWSEGGGRPFADIAAGSATIVQILELTSGSMLFAHENGFGLIGPDFKVTPLQALGGLDLRSGRGPLRVSADGGTVQVDLYEPRHSDRFALGDRRVDIDPPADSTLLAPVTQAPGLAVTNWENSTTPALIEVQEGPVIETIISVAEEIGADIIAMPTAGRHGLFDALRGSVTERVLREAPCPVLAVPVM
jgi:nucleotide-binding universal stress UspA family protein